MSVKIKRPNPSNSYSDYAKTPGSGGLTRSNSLRSSSGTNWKTAFPSLTRTPSNLQQQNIGLLLSPVRPR